MSNHHAARRTNRNPSFSFKAPAQRVNTKGGSVYVFGDSSAVEVDSSDYDGIELPVLSHRKGNKATTPDICDQKSKFVFISRDLTANDTLRSLSLQYGCPVSEIKRANNIYSEQDFHGRVQLRIPVPIYSPRTDPEEQAKLQPEPGTRLKDIPNGVESSDDLEGTTSDDGFSHSAGRKTALRAERLLQRLDEDLSAVRHEIEDENGVLHDEQSQLLSRVAPDTEFRDELPLSQSTAAKEVDQADVCGLTWRSMVILGIIMLAFIVGFFIYISKNRKSLLDHWATSP